MTPSDTPPVGGDWVLRPSEPTEEMVAAAVESLHLPWREIQRMLDAFRIMNAAAPPPPVGDREAVAVQWRPIETAPKDGTKILAWTVHEFAKYSDDPLADGWAAPSIIRWIDHNGGGWTWNGLCGQHTHWKPLPDPPSLSPGELALADPLPPERCVCGCNSFARMDEEAPGGGYRKGRQFRCIHCKREHDERRDATATEARGDIDGR